jgi:hypothetical protein
MGKSGSLGSHKCSGYTIWKSTYRFTTGIGHQDLKGGNSYRLKACLCAKGFTQRPAIDFFETFSPVGHRQSFRLLLSFTVSIDLEMKGLDITAAFLHSPLKETIYMRLPQEVNIGRGKVARLKKALYGLKQTGRCWYEKLDTWLCSIGWTRNQDNPCVYMVKNAAGTVSLMLYVHIDDQAIAGRPSEETDTFIDTLHRRFPCKRQGNLQHFLGMEIHRNRNKRTIWITQTQYTLRILQKVTLLECKTRDIPMSLQFRSRIPCGSKRRRHCCSSRTFLSMD